MVKKKYKLYVFLVSTLLLIVFPINALAIDLDPPDVNAGRDWFASTGDNVILDGSNSHDDQTPDAELAFYWEQIDVSARNYKAYVELINPDTAKASFIAPEYVGDLHFQLTVKDLFGNSETDEIVITIYEDLDESVFVSSSYGEDSNDGSMFNPVKTVSRAFELATPSLLSPIGSSWDKFYGDEYHQIANALIKTSDGGLAFAGYSSGHVAGLEDFWLVRTDADGNNPLFNKYDHEGDDRAADLVQCSDGGFALVGGTKNNVNNDRDIMVIRTESDGSLRWSNTYERGFTDERAHAIVELSDGFAILGYTKGLMGPTGYDFDAWLIRIDNEGNLLWDRTYGGTYLDEAFDLIHCENGGFAMCGYVDIGGIPEILGNGYETWLLRVEENGDFKWQKTYLQSGSWHWKNSLVQCSDFGFAIAGYTTLSPELKEDAYLIRTESDGELRWTKTYDYSESSDRASSLIECMDGGFALGGRSGVNGQDFLLIRTKANGDPIWSENYGGERVDQATDIILAHDGGLLLAGFSDTYYYEGKARDAWLVKVADIPESTFFKDIYIEEGIYNEATTLRVSNDMSIYGGFSVDVIVRPWEEAFIYPPIGLNIYPKWQRDAEDPTEINGAATTFEVKDIEDHTVIDGLTINSADGLYGIFTGGAGENSIAIYIDNASNNLHITNNFINAGKGGNGKPGQPGNDGIKGNDGYDGKSFGGIGGNSPVGFNGGNGGIGGLYAFIKQEETIWEYLDGLNYGDPCAIAEGAPGDDGKLIGIYNHGNGGNAKVAPASSFIPIKVIGEDGESASQIPLSGNDGEDGSGGQGNNIAYMLSNHKWLANKGKDGSDGSHGYGGGGGGGGGGAVKFVFKEIPGTPGLYFGYTEINIGGGGGGGGGGGEAGTAGKGGHGGGASFGVFLYNSRPKINGNFISTEGGGNGGDGGLGGIGGEGGEGGDGGKGSSDAGNGGHGGPGGDGGNGGQGGGGAGGSSCGIYQADPDRSHFSGLNYFTEHRPPIVGLSLIGPAGAGGIGGEDGNGETGCRGEVCPPQQPGVIFPDHGGTINPGESTVKLITMPRGIKFAKFKDWWTGSDIVMSLTSPSGNFFSRDTLNEDVYHSRGTGSETYTVIDPEEGEWKITLFGADIPPEGEPYSLSVELTPKNNAPIAQVQDITLTAEINGFAYGSIDAGSYDSDPYDNIWITQNPSGPYPCGETLVTLTVYDKQGAFDTAQAVVTVIDETPPTIEIPPVIFTKADESGGTTVLIEPIISDNCDPDPVITKSYIGDWYPIGVTEVIFSATDASGNTVSESVSVSVAENLPPQTTDDYEYDDIWTNQDALITLQFSDSSPSSGWLWTKYSIDDTGTSEPSIDFTEPISITSEGISYLRYHSMDTAENLEPVQQITIKIDKTAPETTIEFGDTHFIINDDVHLTLYTPILLYSTEIKDGSGVFGSFYKITNETFDSGWIPFTNAFTLEFLDIIDLHDGDYELHYYSRDFAGNDEVIKRISIVLDNSAPILSWECEGCALQDKFTFRIGALDLTGVSDVSISIRELSGSVVTEIPVEYIGDNLWQALSSFDTITLPDGNYELVVTASDTFGHSITEEFDFSIRNWAVLVLLPSTDSNKAGRTMPIKFSLRVSPEVDSEMPFVINQELEIFITDLATYDVLQHSTYGDDSTSYRISETEKLYITNFKTHKIPTIYRVMVYRKDFFIDAFEFETVK